ncbi:Carotenoid cleavage dioxygenase 7, chloroplastic [Asimina triloba]
MNGRNNSRFLPYRCFPRGSASNGGFSKYDQLLGQSGQCLPMPLYTDRHRLVVVNNGSSENGTKMQAAAAPCRFFGRPIRAQVSPPPPPHRPLPPAKIRPKALTGAAEVIHVADRSRDDDAVAAFWDYQFLFVSQRAETANPVALRAVQGAIPADFPSGTYYLAGPGLFVDDHGSSVHPLDGHGYLRAFEVDGRSGEVRFSARYVATEAQAEEHDRATGRWRFTYRGPFSVLRRGRMVGNTKVMKNVANTSVLKWGAHLLCLWEGGDPYEVESRTLNTVGPFRVVDDGDDASRRTVGGGLLGLGLGTAAAVLKPILHGVFKMPAKRLLSHYKIDARRNRLLVMASTSPSMVSLSLSKSKEIFALSYANFELKEIIWLFFAEFDANFKLLQKHDYSIPDHLMIHDWAFTDTHYVVLSNRIKLDVPGKFMLDPRAREIKKKKIPRPVGFARSRLL